MSNSNLFEKDDPEIIELWDRILTSQVDFTFGLELSAYYRTPEWHRAVKVLDLGTGNGYYLHRVAQRFPEKTYLGIDQSAKQIDIARKRYQGDGVSFQCADLFDMRGTYDFILLRAVVQHIVDLPRLVAQIRSLLHERGAAIIVDSEDRDPFLLWPSAPSVEHLFNTLSQKQSAAQSLSGEPLSNFLQMAVSSGTLEATDWTLIIPTTVDDNLNLLRDQYRSIIELLRRTEVVSADFVEAAREWEHWCSLPHAYADMRVKIIRLRDRVLTPDVQTH